MTDNDKRPGFGEGSSPFSGAPSQTLTPPRPAARLLAQAIVVLAFAIAALGIGGMIHLGYEWYGPTLALIVAARFAVDHFFTP